MENTLTNHHVNKLALAGIGIAAGLFGGTQAISANTIHVNAGDTLTTLANQNGTTVDALKSANNLSSDLIYANTDLQAPDANTDDQVVNDTYTVKAGDTLSTIAENHGSDVNQIKQANGLTSDLIYVGQQLKLHVTADAQQAPAASQATTQANNSQTATQTQQTTVSQSVAPSNQTTVTTNYGSSNYSSNLGGSEQAAKDWIASHESGGNYNATNGQYIGKYQLSSSYLHGDYSPANQERVADQYVAQRYGSWQNAQAHWMSNGWY